MKCNDMDKYGETDPGLSPWISERQKSHLKNQFNAIISDIEERISCNEVA